MLRHKSLIPLSRQHQHALALCVRIDRASPIADDQAGAWQAEIAQHFQSEIAIHFAAEEEVLFPAASNFADLAPLVEELKSDHACLRQNFAGAIARTLSGKDVAEMAERLSSHIRKEERQLFERMQQMMDADTMAALGQKLDTALQDASQTCALPRDTMQLDPRSASSDDERE